MLLFFNLLLKLFSSKDSDSSKESSASCFQVFILEPILTPSAFLDLPNDGQDIPDLDTIDIDIDEFSVANTVENAAIAPLWDNFEDIAWITDKFEAGVFTVGDTGEVGVEFLFDGGKYQGELAIFSLDGMENLEPGSEDFIAEAARRAFSDTEEGHIVISDKIEGALFSGNLGEDQVWNSGEYQGEKVFQMRSGDTFGMMLVPNGTVEDVVDNPNIGGSKTPLFSLATANPEDGLHIGQIADVDGDSNTFVMEDWRIDRGSDNDYNDFIFRITGATGEAPEMEDLIDDDLDWQETELGQDLIDYITPNEPISQPKIEEFPVENQPLVGIIDTGFSSENPDLDYDNITLGSDFIDGDVNPLINAGEGSEHGTHVLGIIGATQDNDLGIDGINDDAPLWVSRAVGSGKWADSLVEFVDAAKESGQPNAVVNLSLDLTQIDAEGNITTRYELTHIEREALEYARQNDVLVVVAAGNDNDVMSALGQASQEFDNIITVGSADGLERAEYSSYGRGLDILAEGGTIEEGVLSTVEDAIGTMSGTSVATAKVTGAISQVWAANPELNYRQVINIVKETATDLETPGWDSETGSGLLNSVAAISAAKMTQGEVYEPDQLLTPTTWTGEGKVTPQERAVKTRNISNFGRKIYNGYLYSGNEEDVLKFTASSNNRTLELAINKDSKAKVKVYENGRYRGQARQDRHNSSKNYLKVSLNPGSSYEVRIEEESSSGKNYDLIMNFDGQSTSGTNGSITVSEKPGGNSLNRPPKGDNKTNNSRSDAYNLGVIDTNRTIDHEWVGDPDSRDYYKFTINERSKVDIRVDSLTDGVDLRTYYANGYSLLRSTNDGTANEHISDTWPAGTYYVKVSQDDDGDNTSYRLRIKTESVNSSGGSSGSGSSGSGQTGTNSEIPVGFDGVTTYPKYGDTYDNQDGKTKLGQPKDKVHTVGNGSMQHFKGGSEGSGALMKHDWTNTPYWVGSNFWTAFSQVGGADSIMKYPVSNRYNVTGGKRQDFQGGRILESAKGTFPVFGAIFDRYKKEGSERGWLGFPTSGQISLGNGVVRQNFENGYIQWNGSQAVAYQNKKTSSNSTPVKPTPKPKKVKQENWGTLYGRHEKGLYSGSGLFEFKLNRMPDGRKQNLQFALRNSNGDNISLSDAKIEILNSQKRPLEFINWNPSVGLVPGKLDLFHGKYYVRVTPKSNVNYQVVMNFDTSNTTDLGVLEDRKSSSDYTALQYVGSGDESDKYTFQVKKDTFVHFALKPVDGDVKPNMHNAKMTLQDASGNDISLENIRLKKDENYGTAWLKKGETYTMEVSRELDKETNYKFVVNPDYSQQPSEPEPNPEPIPTTYPANFAEALAFVRRWEGGYVNDPNDKGGATNKGITQGTYNTYLASKELPSKDVLEITDDEVNDIYYTRYWLQSGSDQLTSRLALIHFDTAVNMGVGTANLILQQARQSSNQDEMSIVRRYLELRESKYREYAKGEGQSGFLQGWLNRVNDLRVEVEKEQETQGQPLENTEDEIFINETTNWKTEVFKWIGSGSEPPSDRTQIRDGGDFIFLSEMDLGTNNRFPDQDRNEKGLALEQEPNNEEINNHAGDFIGLPSDRFVIKSYTQANFTQGVEYEFMARGDDGYQIWAKHLETNTWEKITPPNQWQHNHEAESYPFIPEKSGEYYIVNYYYENEGHAGFGMNWKSLAPLLHSDPTEDNPLTGFSHPLQGTGYISQGNHGNTSHDGAAAYAVDYAVPMGTPVYAISSGTVALAQDSVIDLPEDEDGTQTNWENTNYILIALDDGDGVNDDYQALYLHIQNNSIQVEQGDRVEAGQLIAYSGHNGWSLGPHLHLQVQRPSTHLWWGNSVSFEINV